MPRRLIMLLALLALSGGLAACGTKEDRTTKGETEGSYLDVGPLKYQVQISRQLNARDPEDRTYLVGLSGADRVLAKDSVWFAVFVRAENETDNPKQAAIGFRIETTTGETFKPVDLAATNTFAYRPQPIPGKSQLPIPGSVPSDIGINGNLLLFKIPRQSLENRPLEFIITSPDGSGESSVALDV